MAKFFSHYFHHVHIIYIYYSLTHCMGLGFVFDCKDTIFSHHLQIFSGKRCQRFTFTGFDSLWSRSSAVMTMVAPCLMDDGSV